MRVLNRCDERRRLFVVLTLRRDTKERGRGVLATSVTTTVPGVRLDQNWARTEDRFSDLVRRRFEECQQDTGRRVDGACRVSLLGHFNAIKQRLGVLHNPR